MKRKDTTTLVLIVITILLVSGCMSNSFKTNAEVDDYGVPNTQSDESGAEYTKEDFMLVPDDSKESFLDVGQTVKIWFLQHSTRNWYQVGLRRHDNKLVWYDISPESVYLEEDIETSYIERLEDIPNGFGTKTQYVLHLRAGTPIMGGDIPNGKHGVTETEMIIGGGSE